MKKEKLALLPGRLVIEILIINLMFAVFSLLLQCPYDESGDDFTISAIASGMYGTSSAFVTYPNVLLGAVWKYLYSICSSIPWCVIMYFGMVGVSYVAYSYIAYMACGKWVGRIFTLVLLFLTRDPFYVVMNYTRVAAMTGIAGLLLIIYGYRSNSKLLSIVGGILTNLGALYRLKSFLMIAPLGFVLCLILLWRDSGYHSVSQVVGCIFTQIKERKKVMVIILCAFLVLASAIVLDKFMYESNDLLSAYSEYNDARGSVVDYAIPNYEDHAETFDKLGITQNDLTLLESWSFADPETFTTETLQQIASLMKASEPVSLGKILRTIRGGLQVFSICKFFILGTIVCIFCFLYPLSQHKNLRFSVFLIYLTAIFLLSYLYTTGRYFPRVTDPLGLAFIITTVLCLMDGLTVEKVQPCAFGAIIIFCILCTGEFWFSEAHFWPASYEEDRYTRDGIFYEEFPKENLYLVDALSADRHCLPNYVFEVPEPGWGSNYYQLGEWTTMHPVTNQCLENYGVENPYRALYTMDNVFLVTGTVGEPVETKITHIEEKYCEHVDWSIVEIRPKCLIIAVQPPTNEVLQEKYIDLSVSQEYSAVDDLTCFRLSGEFSSAEFSEKETYSIRIVGSDDVTHCFRVSANEQDGVVHFFAELPQNELAEGTYSVELLCSKKGETSYLWQSETISVNLIELPESEADLLVS